MGSREYNGKAGVKGGLRRVKGLKEGREYENEGHGTCDSENFTRTRKALVGLAVLGLELVGLTDGLSLGLELGCPDGLREGCEVGALDGCSEGCLLG